MTRFGKFQFASILLINFASLVHQVYWLVVLSSVIGLCDFDFKEIPASQNELKLSIPFLGMVREELQLATL